MSRVLLLALTISMVATLIGCATMANQYFVAGDSRKTPQPGDSLVVVCGRADGASHAYAREVSRVLQIKGVFRIIAESTVREAYPEYPVNIVASMEGTSDQDIPRLRAIGNRLGAQYVLAVWMLGLESSVNGVSQGRSAAFFGELVSADDPSFVGISGFSLADDSSSEGADRVLLTEAARQFADPMLAAVKMGR